MIVQHTYEKVMDGTKTQARPLVKPGDIGVITYNGDLSDCFTDDDGELCVMIRHDELSKHPISYVRNKRIKWQVGRTYAVQPGHGQKAIGRIRITGIRQERLCDITEADALAEGFLPSDVLIADGFDRLSPPDSGLGNTSRHSFMYAWDRINKPKSQYACNLNPLVWVLEFGLSDD